MDNSKRIVIISVVTIVLISLIVSAIGWNFRTYDSRFSDQKCSREGIYCIFNDIPAGMLYSRPEQSLQGVNEFQGDPQDYIVSIHDLYYGGEEPRTPTPKSEIFYIPNIDDYECTSTGETPEIVEYFTEFCGSEIRYGCATERRAFVCGNEYLIQEKTEYESKLYGPYNLPSIIN